MLNQTKKVKENLLKYVEREYVSVRSTNSDRQPFKIAIKGRIGVEQAFASRQSLEKAGFNLFFYGIYDETGLNCIERHYVRITYREPLAHEQLTQPVAEDALTNS